MAVVYSTSNGAGDSSAALQTQDSGSVVVPAGALVLAFVGNSDGAPIAPVTVTLDPTGTPQALSLVGSVQSLGPYGKFSAWAKHNASSITAAIRADWGSGNTQGERLVQALVYTGAAASGAIGTPVFNTGTGTAVTTGAISTTVGDLVVACAYRLDTLAAIDSFDSPNGTERVETPTNPSPYDRQAVQDTVATGSTTTLTWTLSGAPTEGWVTVAFVISPSGAAAADQPPAPEGEWAAVSDAVDDELVGLLANAGPVGADVLVQVSALRDDWPFHGTNDYGVDDLDLVTAWAAPVGADGATVPVGQPPEDAWSHFAEPDLDELVIIDFANDYDDTLIDDDGWPWWQDPDLVDDTLAMAEPAEAVDAGVAQTPVPVSDTASGAEAVALAVAAALADTGSGADFAALNVGTSQADAGSGSEAAALAVAVSAADVGAGADAPVLAVVLAVADGAAGGDGVAVDTGGVPVPVSDSATGTSSITVAVALTAADAAAGAEAIALAVAVAAADAATAADQVALDTGGTPVARSDSAAGVDAVSIAAALAASDASAGNEAPAVAVAMGLADAGAGASLAAIVATLARASSGAGADGVSVSQAGSAVSLNDAASGVSSIAVAAALLALDAGLGTEAIAIAGRPSGASAARTWRIAPDVPLSGTEDDTTLYRLRASMDPQARLDFSTQWADWLADGGDAVQTLVISVSGAVTLQEELRNDTLSTAWVSTPAAGAEGTVSWYLTTAAGRRARRSIVLQGVLR